MENPLSGAKLKFARARQQIKSLDNEIRAFLKTRPYVPIFNFDKNARDLTVRVKIERYPPPMWGIYIGEIAHNLRSALDHIVWQIVALNTGREPRTKQNQFPIFESEAGFKDRGIKKFLIHAGCQAINLIQSEQPFSTGEGVSSPLWHLKEVSDVDKHRTIHLTGTLIQAIQAKFGSLLEDVDVTQVETRVAGPIQKDALLMRYRLTGTSTFPFRTTQVNAKLSVSVAFDERTPAVGGGVVIPILLNAAKRAERISRRIAKEVFKIDELYRDRSSMLG
jgi:hypothetical protein